MSMGLEQNGDFRDVAIQNMDIQCGNESIWCVTCDFIQKAGNTFLRIVGVVADGEQCVIQPHSGGHLEYTKKPFLHKLPERYTLPVYPIGPVCRVQMARASFVGFLAVIIRTFETRVIKVLVFVIFIIEIVFIFIFVVVFTC
jgi:hypothetical protein